MNRLFILSLLVFALAACGTLTDDGTGLLFRTADPRLTIGVRLLPAPAPPASTPAIVPPTAAPTEEPIVELPTVTPVPCEPVIKGNISADGTRIAHSPGQANYESTIIDEAKGEKLFCTLEEAIAEGWRAAKN